MKDGAIVCNSGHFNVEIDIPALEKLSSGHNGSRVRSSRNTRWRTAAGFICSAKAA